MKNEKENIIEPINENFKRIKEMFKDVGKIMLPLITIITFMAVVMSLLAQLGNVLENKILFFQLGINVDLAYHVEIDQIVPTMVLTTLQAIFLIISSIIFIPWKKEYWDRYCTQFNFKNTKRKKMYYMFGTLMIVSLFAIFFALISEFNTMLELIILVVMWVILCFYVRKKITIPAIRYLINHEIEIKMVIVAITATCYVVSLMTVVWPVIQSLAFQHYKYIAVEKTTNSEYIVIWQDLTTAILCDINMEKSLHDKRLIPNCSNVQIGVVNQNYIFRKIKK